VAFDIPQEPGLSNLLVGQVKASECVRKASAPGLWILSAGRIPPNPAELLGANRFRELVSGISNHFDWIIFDCPPVMAVTDASLIAHRVSAVVFVVGSEMTARQNAKFAIQQLGRAQASFAGAVLNRVDLERDPFYYSQYYRREYVQYYAKTS
jgi:capsular exopolysaccharide synthesis family protein